LVAGLVIARVPAGRLSEAGLKRHDKEPEAVKLRAETTMTLKWIATRLEMGTGASLSNVLTEQRRGTRW
jgi:hypothetical protein